MKTFISEFQEVKIWLTDQTSKPLEPRERRFVKGYGFMSFARNFSDKYSKSLMDKGIDVNKTFAKTAGDLIGNKISDNITAKPSGKSYDEVINGIPKERYISPKEKQKIIDELKLA